MASQNSRTQGPYVRATPNSPITKAPDQPEEVPAEEEFDEEYITSEDAPSGPPAWFGWTTFVLAIIGLGISIYETYAHYTSNQLLGCSSSPNGTFDCTAVITSSQSMVFNVLPVAVLGLAFYVVAIPLFSPWAWRLQNRLVGLFRLASMVIGMGFVMYLIYTELYQIHQVCEYCTGVHIVTFLLFCLTVFSVAIWGLVPHRAVDDALEEEEEEA
jgi:uncharacterized membrane protein